MMSSIPAISVFIQEQIGPFMDDPEIVAPNCKIRCNCNKTQWILRNNYLKYYRRSKVKFLKVVQSQPSHAQGCMPNPYNETLISARQKTRSLSILQISFKMLFAGQVDSAFALKLSIKGGKDSTTPSIFLTPLISSEHCIFNRQ